MQSEIEFDFIEYKKKNIMQDLVEIFYTCEFSCGVT